MRKITQFLLLTAAIVALGGSAKAQSTIDFETVGQDWTWTVFSNGSGGGDDASLLTIPAANPDASGINTSAHCAKLVDATTANPWGGTFSTGIGSVTFTSSNCIVKVMVYKDVISNFDVKFEGGTNPASYEVQVANTKTNQWEELTFDFSSQIGKTYTQITIIPDFPTTRTAGSTSYFDNISFNAVTAPPSGSDVPSTVATAPASRNANQVVSIYGTNSYTNISGVNMNPDWGQAGNGGGYADYTISGTTHHVVKYGPLCYQGIDFQGNAQNVSTMENLHFDLFTNSGTFATPIKILLAKAGIGTFHAVVNVTTTNGSGWNSIDVPMSSFVKDGTGAQSFNSIDQIEFISNAWDTNDHTVAHYPTIYLDNIYFWTSAACSDTQAPVWDATNPASSTNHDDTSVTLSMLATDNTVGGTLTYNISYGTGGLASATAVEGTVATQTITGLTPATQYTFTITVKDACGNVSTTSQQVVVTTSSSIPASPTPTSAASDVLSIFSDAYTASATNLVNQNWWGGAWSNYTLAGGGNALKFIAINGGAGGGGGIQFDNLDVSAMSYFHVDVYPLTGAAALLKYNVVPVGGGGAGWTFFTSLIDNQWNSVNIPVSALALPGTSVFQVGFGTFGGDGAFLVDNIFFSKTVSALNNVTSSDGVICYPGIVSDNLIVSAKSDISQIAVHNILGQTIKNINAGGQQQVIDLSSVAAGNYFVTVKLANGHFTTQKIVKR